MSKAELGKLFIELQYALVVLFAYVGAIGIVYLEGICYGFQAAGMILVAMRNEYALKLAHAILAQYAYKLVRIFLPAGIYKIEF